MMGAQKYSSRNQELSRKISKPTEQPDLGKTKIVFFGNALSVIAETESRAPKLKNTAGSYFPSDMDAEFRSKTQSGTSTFFSRNLGFLLRSCYIIWTPDVFFWALDSGYRFFRYMIKIWLVFWNCGVYLSAHNFVIKIVLFYSSIFDFIGYVEPLSSDWLKLCFFMQHCSTAVLEAWNRDSICWRNGISWKTLAASQLWIKKHRTCPRNFLFPSFI